MQDEKQLNPSTNGCIKEKERKKKRGDRRDRRPKGPYNPYRKYIPNGYGISVNIQPKEYSPNNLLKDLLKYKESNHNIPFYTLKRFYMKTICNMITDLVDIAYYSKNIMYLNNDDRIIDIKIDGPITREKIMSFIFDDAYVIKAYRKFDKAANRSTAGVPIEPHEDDRDAFRCLTPEGDVVTWIVDKSMAPRNNSVDQEHTIIEKEDFNIFVEWLLDKYVDSPIYPISAHQWAAIQYLKAVYNQVLFD